MPRLTNFIVYIYYVAVSSFITRLYASMKSTLPIKANISNNENTQAVSHPCASVLSSQQIFLENLFHSPTAAPSLSSEGLLPSSKVERHESNNSSSKGVASSNLSSDSNSILIEQDDIRNGRSWLMLIDADSFRPQKLPVEISLNLLGYGRLVKFKRGERALVYIEKSKSTMDLRLRNIPFVIAVQWREAKSCLDLWEVSLQKQYNLSLIVVICDNGTRSYELAERWSYSLSLKIREKILLCQTWDIAFSALAIWEASRWPVSPL